MPDFVEAVRLQERVTRRRLVEEEQRHCNPKTEQWHSVKLQETKESELMKWMESQKKRKKKIRALNPFFAGYWDLLFLKKLYILNKNSLNKYIKNHETVYFI